MVKKTIHILVIVLLLISTIGVTINKHYSDGELFSIALFGEAESCCEGPCDCCSDETEHYQINVDFLQSNISNFDLLFSNIILFIINDVSTDKITPFQFVDDISPTKLSNIFAFLQVFLY